MIRGRVGTASDGGIARLAALEKLCYKEMRQFQIVPSIWCAFIELLTPCAGPALKPAGHGRPPSTREWAPLGSLPVDGKDAYAPL